MSACPDRAPQHVEARVAVANFGWGLTGLAQAKTRAKSPWFAKSAAKRLVMPNAANGMSWPAESFDFLEQVFGRVTDVVITPLVRSAGRANTRRFLQTI